MKSPIRGSFDPDQEFCISISMTKPLASRLRVILKESGNTRSILYIDVLDDVLKLAETPNADADAMIEAIRCEARAAAKEERNPCSSNVIAIFRSKTKTELSPYHINALFDVVFKAYQEVAGAEVGKIGPDRNN